MQSSSGISQPARLLHKACRWHTQITSIQVCRTMLDNRVATATAVIRRVAPTPSWHRSHSPTRHLARIASNL
ncbi:hypothetical protein B0042_1840 [Bifidobacterium adolescentis]|uniref:Uncharacterized protein n=1 Tax=Bifidobacterium adolescentis TaxID=1680 RepID=A0A1X3A472_BIFAD|nr:hypothetical protein B0042_1840 [Bifidobacterium adolescentis]OSH01524.1 hypothetical protein AL0467_1847 [Bifidobacterium adolescentis]